MRRLAWWIFNHIYVGKLAPWLFGFAIGRMPHKIEKPKEGDRPRYGGNYFKFSDN